MPWADVMYAMDRDFWRAPSSDRRRWPTILAEAIDVFEGERIVPFPVEGCRRERFRLCHNSGVGAIALAAHLGASRIILLGFDCKVGPQGQKHHHADHPAPLGNCGSIKTWQNQFRKLAGELAGKVEIINATRETALEYWPRLSLEEALADVRTLSGVPDDHRHRPAPVGHDDRHGDDRARHRQAVLP